MEWLRHLGHHLAASAARCSKGHTAEGQGVMTSMMLILLVKQPYTGNGVLLF